MNDDFGTQVLEALRRSWEWLRSEAIPQRALVARGRRPHVGEHAERLGTLATITSGGGSAASGTARRRDHRHGRR